MKDAIFLGDTLEVIRSFPEAVRQATGSEIRRVQNGFDPSDFKPMTTVGKGGREIRIRERAGAFRVIYVATFEDAVYVLHAFQKKTQRTAQRDLDLAKRRLSILESKR